MVSRLPRLITNLLNSEEEGKPEERKLFQIGELISIQNPNNHQT